MKRGDLILNQFGFLDDTSDVKLNRKQRRALLRWYKKFKPISKEEL